MSLIDNIGDMKYWTVIKNSYLKERNIGKLYQPDSRIAPSLIVFFYNLFPNAYFDLGLANFRRKYIDNETDFEQRTEIIEEHSNFERKGLGVMYDYIEKYKLIDGEFTIFEIKNLHKLLFAYAPYPEYAGRFRESSVRLSNSSVDTSSADRIIYDLFDLSDEFDRIIGLPINTCEDIINYIRECVILHTKLLKVHPFEDGNGRSIRALLNLMFKRANLPPVYVEPREKGAYLQALKKAQIDNEYNASDYTDIVMFYYYKICDSLIEITDEKENTSRYEVDNDGVKIFQKKFPEEIK